MRRALGWTAGMGLAAALVAALALTGCDPQPPADDGVPTASADEPALTSADARDMVLALADEAAAALTESTQADLTENTALGPSRSSDCSSSPSATGGAIQWAADRDWSLESGESTADMLDPIVEHFVADGWEVTRDDPEGTRFVQLDRDGYMLQMSGEPAARSGQATQIGVTAISPCLEASGPG